MKKFLIILALVFAVAQVNAAVDSTSVRLKGINDDLNGILLDEYTDALINPADILRADGWRVYTNLSNLKGKTDTAFDLAANDTASYMLGIWGDPLAGILPVRSRLGILYDWTGSMSRSAYSLDMDGSGVFAGTVNGYNETGGNALGEITNATNVKTDNDTNNKFADTGDTLRNVNSSAKHLTETGVGDFQVIYGLELMSDLALGININKQGTALDDPNNWATKREDFTYTAANTTRKDYTVDAKQDAKTTIKNSQFLIMPGVRFKLTSGVEVGAAVMLNTVSNENKTDTSVTVTEDNAPTNAIANTFTATSTDASNIATTGLWANPYAAAQLDDDNDGTVNEDAVDGLDNDGDGLVDEDPVSPLTRKFSGTGIGVAPDARFKLSNNVALIARINLVSTPQTFEASNTNTYNSTRKNAGVTTTVDNTSPITWTGDRKTNVFGLSGGTEAKLAQNVTLGAALKYINTSVKTVMNGTYTMTNVAFVDNNSDGSINGADAKVTNTNNSTWTNSIETKVNTLQIPIGLEMQVVKGLNARLGATHTVTDTTTTNAANATDLNRIKTETETAIVGGTATTKTYVNADGTQTFNNTTQTAHTVSHSTAYYFGAGYVWSENLSFDILCNANLVNLASWKIGATLSF